MTYDELKTLRMKATQGPWYFSTEPARVGDKLIAGTQKVSAMGDCCLEDQGSPQNIEFIAALVNFFDLPSTQAMLEKGERKLNPITGEPWDTWEIDSLIQHIRDPRNAPWLSGWSPMQVELMLAGLDALATAPSNHRDAEIPTLARKAGWIGVSDPLRYLQRYIARSEKLSREHPNPYALKDQDHE